MTHAGGLPRPHDLARMMYDVIEEKPVDDATLTERVIEAIADMVARQRDLELDVISDGEIGK